MNDEVLEVDGHPVTADNIAEYIIGTDESNTSVDLTLMKADGSGRQVVRLVRMYRPLLNIAEDLFETLVKLRNALSKVAPDSIAQLERALDAVSALQIGNFDDRQAFLDRISNSSTNQVSWCSYSYVRACGCAVVSCFMINSSLLQTCG